MPRCWRVVTSPSGIRCANDRRHGGVASGSEFVKKSGVGHRTDAKHPRFPGESRDLSLHWPVAASNRNDLPTEEGFVRPRNGPRLSPGKRVDDQHRKSFTSCQTKAALPPIVFVYLG